MYATQHRCMAFKIDVSRTKLINFIFQFILKRKTLIQLTTLQSIDVYSPMNSYYI